MPELAAPNGGVMASKSNNSAYLLQFTAELERRIVSSPVNCSSSMSWKNSSGKPCGRFWFHRPARHRDRKQKRLMLTAACSKQFLLPQDFGIGVFGPRWRDDSGAFVLLLKETPEQPGQHPQSKRGGRSRSRGRRPGDTCRICRCDLRAALTIQRCRQVLHAAASGIGPDCTWACPLPFILRKIRRLFLRLGQHFVDIIHQLVERRPFAITRMRKADFKIGSHASRVTAKNDNAVCQQDGLFDVVRHQEDCFCRDQAFSSPQFQQFTA